MDRVGHLDVLERADEKFDGNIDELRHAVRCYLDALAEMITEADPEREIVIFKVGVIEITKRVSYTFRNIHTKELEDAPSRRNMNIRPSERVQYPLVVSLEKLGYNDP